MIGFQRRFDEAYLKAKEDIDKGLIGPISLIRTYSLDPIKGLDSFINFAGANYSGGLFLDMAIHDIDLILWLTQSQVKKVWALGTIQGLKAFEDFNDVACGSAMMELDHQMMALLVASRSASHGYHIETEIIGSKGMIKIDRGIGNLGYTLYNDQGLVNEVYNDFIERFKEAYLSEIAAFVRCIEHNEEVPISLESSIEASRIGYALKQSLETNECLILKK
ncbi:MAG: Gfo/Idh/MocA family protein [Bacilli bacterium]